MIVNIPGYAEAVEAERAARLDAFLPIAEDICGIPQVPFTLRHYFFLEAIRSPFACGGVSTVEDVAMFLWICSPGFKASNDWLTRWKRARFIRRCRKVPFLECVARILERLEQAFQDRISSTGAHPSAAPAADVAMIVHTIASHYRWSQEKILSMPMAALMQYLRLIQLARDPECPVINRSDRIKSDWLKERNRQRKADEGKN